MCEICCVMLQIGEAQSRLRHVLHMLAAVQGEVQQLGEMKQTADTPTWQAGVARLQRLKVRILLAVKVLLCPK